MSLQDLLDVVPSGSEELSLLRSIDFARLPRHGAIIMDAGRALVGEAARSGRDPSTIGEHDLAAHLYTAGQPDPDLLIRTSGELRISIFLLWQIAYAEIWVTEVLWPDFRRRHLLQ